MFVVEDGGAYYGVQDGFIDLGSIDGAIKFTSQADAGRFAALSGGTPIDLGVSSPRWALRMSGVTPYRYVGLDNGLFDWSLNQSDALGFASRTDALAAGPLLVEPVEAVEL